jgi:hypothetical protein
MSISLAIDGWHLARSTDEDFDELMTWFGDEHSVNVWSVAIESILLA